MKNYYLFIIFGLILVILVISVIKIKKSKLDKHYFQNRWRNLQRLCSNRKLWYQAVIDADELLDEALKKKHYRGKTTGERLVSAQKELSSNDSVWFGHKLKNRIIEEKLKRINKGDTLEALGGFRQALKDLGALPDSSEKKEA